MGEAPLLTGIMLDHQLTPVDVLDRVVLVMSPRMDGRVLRGLGESTQAVLRLRAFYWLRIDRIGTLRVRITSVDPYAGPCFIYHFSVSYFSN